EERCAIVMEDDLGAVAAHRRELRLRRGGRHHDDARRPELARRPCHRLRVIAGRDRDETSRPLGVGEARHLVERAARLERADLLEVLALEREIAAGEFGERVRLHHRRAMHPAMDARRGGTDLVEWDHEVTWSTLPAVHPFTDPVPIEAIHAARMHIAGAAIRTPLVRLNVEDAPAEIFLKLENLQPIGSFKIRGACNAIAIAPHAALARGVWTASAGN